MNDMDTRKVLSSLCYFSIFFAGFLFPLVVYFVTGDEVTKTHAKKSLLSHLIPLILTPLIVAAFWYDFATLHDQVPAFTIMSFVAFMLIWIIVLIWNVVKGVKILTAE